MAKNKNLAELINYVDASTSGTSGSDVVVHAHGSFQIGRAHV